MREVGINVVRIGEFAWSVIEPEEGNIDVSFFKEMIKRMYDNGIETIMCTPTPTPPIWLSHGRPERMHINEKREVMGHGSRQHACTNNPYFDFASYDTYASQDNASAFLLNCDIWRHFKKDRPFWILETSPSYAASLESCAMPHADGYLQAEAVSSYALGSEGFCYWLWRQQRSGSEISHGSVLSAWGEPTIGYQNVLAVERARKEIEPIILSTVPVQAEVAMTYSDRAKAFLKTEPHRGLQHRTLITHFYERILNTGIHRDLVPEGFPLAGYRVLFTPFMPYLSSAFIKKASAFAEEGGIWIAGPLTGGRTGEHTVHTDYGLGELEKTAGIKTLFTFPMNEDAHTGKAFGMTAPLGLWSAVFDTESGNTLGTVESGPGAGHAFLSEREHGKGKMVMLGSLPSGEKGDAMLEALVRHYAGEAAVSVRSDVTPGTVVAPRKGENGLVWVIVNMDGKGGSVTLPEEGTDLLANRSVGAGRLSVGQHEYRVIQFDNRS